jgi:hypothetical protein
MPQALALNLKQRNTTSGCISTRGKVKSRMMRAFSGAAQVLDGGWSAGQLFIKPVQPSRSHVVKERPSGALYNVTNDSISAVLLYADFGLAKGQF